MFLGSWLSIDSRFNQSSATLVIAPSEAESAKMTVHNFVSCGHTTSTMTGTGRLRGENDLVFPAPVITCDDGSQPEGVDATTFQEQFQNLTFTLDPGSDMLTDNFGGVWVRGGAEDKGPESTEPHSEKEIADLLSAFIESRIAGEGAQQYLNGRAEDVPLLYATSSGEPYERGEFEQVSGVEWPYGWTAFRVRLFAGNTVVEQVFFTGPAGRLGLEHAGLFGTGGDLAPTTEDGQPATWANDYFGGEVTVHAAHPWASTGGGNPILLIPAGAAPTTDGGQRAAWRQLVIVRDPVPIGAGCQTGPGADAKALAETIRSIPDIEATTPVAVNAGGAEGLVIDVLARGDTGACHVPLLTPGKESRMRLYLYDAPAGSSMRILAIAMIVPESDFARAVDNTAPITVEFHAP
jgi:hypothetical protein